MKYVAVLDAKNTASFIITGFRGATVGESAANETCEGVTFFRATSCTLKEQILYFSRIQDFLKERGINGLDAALIPNAKMDGLDEVMLHEFCQSMKEISPNIQTIYIGGNNWDEPLLDHIVASTKDSKQQIKSLLGIDPAFDSGQSDPDNDLFQPALKIKRTIESLQLG